MPLPTTIIAATTATWSDHKNQSHGGAQRVTAYTDNTDNGTFYNLGDTLNYCGVSTGYSGQANHKLLRARFYLQRVGNPSGNVFVEVRPTLSPSSATPDLTVLWGMSKSFPASSIPTTGKNEVVFSFPVPATLPTVDAARVAILLTVSAQGDSSNYVKVYRGTCGDIGVYHGYGAGAQVWSEETGGSLLSPSKVVEISKSGARVFTVAEAAGNVLPRRTDDNGGTSWVSESTGSMTTSATFQSVNSQVGINDIGVSYIAHPRSTANQLGQYARSESSGPALDPSTAVSFGTLSTNVSGTAPIFGGRRANGNTILVAQGATETVMGSARRRIKLAFHNGTTWSSLFDVAGSTNTPNATLPGDAVDYELRWAGVDPNGDFHIVYSRSDSSTLQYRKFKADNTFATINTLNGAVASATAAYPVGQPTFYYQSPDWFIAVPYVDNTSNTLKVARCNITTTETSGNWTITQIVAASAEVTASNPAVLVADNAQGGKLFCWRVVPSTRGLQFTDDSGTNTWKPETAWRGATQQVGGISAFYMEDGIALVYLEESTTPDEVRYDRL
jgi:hypothetical protein